MKKTKRKLTFASSALAAGAMIGLTGCPGTTVSLYGNPEDPQPDVYGPPVINEEDYDDPGVEVYGPPEYFDDNADQPVAPLYGPPPDDINDSVETVYGPPEFFEYDGKIESSALPSPEEDLDDPMVDVYGPPAD